MNPLSLVQNRLREFYGWKVVAAGATIWACSAIVWTQGFSNLAVVLKDVDGEFGWSNGFIAFVFALSRAEGAILGVPLGVALKRYNIRNIMRVGAILQLVGFLSLSQMQDRAMFIVSAMVIMAGMTLAGFLTITACTVGWFERKRSRALSLGTMGFAIGGMCGPILVVGFNLFGWRWTVASASMVLAAIIWQLAAVMGVRREDTGEPLDGLDPLTLPDKKRAAGVQDNHFTTGEAVRTRTFWMITFGHGTALLVVSSVMLLLPLYLVQDRDFSATRAAVVAGLVPMVQLVGTFVGGYLGDRFNKRLIAGVAMLMHGLGLLALTFATNWFFITIFVVFHGLAWGARGPQMAAIRADYFGTTSFGPIMGISSMIITIFAIAGPLLAGNLADITGDFQLGFTILSIATIAGFVFFVFATPPTTTPASATASAKAGTIDSL